MYVLYTHILEIENSLEKLCTYSWSTIEELYWVKGQIGGKFMKLAKFWHVSVKILVSVLLLIIFWRIVRSSIYILYTNDTIYILIIVKKNHLWCEFDPSCKCLSYICHKTIIDLFNLDMKTKYCKFNIIQIWYEMKNVLISRFFRSISNPLRTFRKYINWIRSRAH